MVRTFDNAHTSALLRNHDSGGRLMSSFEEAKRDLGMDAADSPIMAIDFHFLKITTTGYYDAKRGVVKLPR
jgi:hypothetical protein